LTVLQRERALVKWKTGAGMFFINSKFDSITKKVCTHKVENIDKRALADRSKGTNNQCLLIHNENSLSNYLLCKKKMQQKKKLVEIVTNI
jgi:hypothetical protein